MINNPNPQGEAQQPRGLVFVNGERAAQLIAFQIDNNAFYQADTFRVTLALASQPPERDFMWWSIQEKLEVELLAGFPKDPDNFTKGELTSWLIGEVDDIEFDQDADTITMVGRDLTSKLIDFKRAIAFVGELTASGVVAQIAKERDLTPVVTATAKPVGTYYQIFHKLIASDITYWDLVTRLAQLEKYQVYVKGRELHFEPRTKPDADPYVIRWQKPTDERGYPIANRTKMTFRRNLSIAKDIKVRVLSWDPKTKKSVDQVADRKRVYNQTTRKVAKHIGPAQEYTYRIPNLTNDQAQRKAQSILEELSRHEMNMHADMPGDTLLTARNIVKVEGTGSAFDQIYYPVSIVRAYGLDEGFRMAVDGMNQTPNNPL